MDSPTRRTLELLRREGWRCAVVEKWNEYVKRSQDLFGFADILAVREGETLAVQATTMSNQSARVKKLAEVEAVQDCLDAGWRVEVWGWHRYKRAVEGDRRVWRETRTCIDPRAVPKEDE